MTKDDARILIIEGMIYAAYKETDWSLYDSDKNRLFGSEYFNSHRIEVRPSPWADGDFESKMTELFRFASALNKSTPAFSEARKLLESEDSLMGRIIRRVTSTR